MRRADSTAGVVLVATIAGMIVATAAHAFEVPPHKDALFAYGPMTAVRAGGAYLDVPYSEKHDIDERDEIAERKVDRRYVDLGVTRSERERTFQTPSGPIAARIAGAKGAASSIVVFVHGRGGDRRLGMNDWSFGGNFNRLKNLMAKAGGLYVTLDAGTLAGDDADRVGSVIEALRSENPQARIVLACASMGGAMCWQLAARPEIAAGLDGLVLLGASSSAQAISGAAPGGGGARIPVLLAHGTRDPVYPFAAQEAAFEAIRKARPSAPIRFVAFDGGNHGTPVRMIDWREALNWIFAN